MGLSYHYEFTAPATVTADELEQFLKALENIGQAAAEVLGPRTALVHGWREVTQGRRWIAERWSNTDAILSQGVGHSQGDRPTFCFKSAGYAQKTHIPST